MPLPWHVTKDTMEHFIDGSEKCILRGKSHCHWAYWSINYLLYSVQKFFNTRPLNADGILICQRAIVYHFVMSLKSFLSEEPFSLPSVIVEIFNMSKKESILSIHSTPQHITQRVMMYRFYSWNTLCMSEKDLPYTCRIMMSHSAHPIPSRILLYRKSPRENLHMSNKTNPPTFAYQRLCLPILRERK